MRRIGSVGGDGSQVLRREVIWAAARERAAMSLQNGGFPPPPRALEATAVSAQRLMKKKGVRQEREGAGELFDVFEGNGVISFQEEI